MTISASFPRLVPDALAGIVYLCSSGVCADAQQEAALFSVDTTVIVLGNPHTGNSFQPQPYINFDVHRVLVVLFPLVRPISNFR